MIKVFIAGPRAVSNLDELVKERLLNILKKNFKVIIGDAKGVDKIIQEYFFSLDYKNVKIYASNGKARNNIGNWEVEKVNVINGLTGFDFFAAKDKEMANVADYGFMIWNGQSKGTLNNVINLLKQSKKTLMYFIPEKNFYCIDKIEDLKKIIYKCDSKTKKMFETLISTQKKPSIEIKEQLLFEKTS
ncbi:MAG: hypothetical protein M0R46_14745 [Candidatus Muirbacterium halophilum]|nr:hypothetical protein [Candidatus Muirbacterium halophilum]